MKILKRLIFLLSFFVLYLIGKEFLILYHYLYNTEPVLAYAFLGFLAALLIFYILLPAFKIVGIRKFTKPAETKAQIEVVRKERMRRFAKNKFLLGAGINTAQLEPTEENYDKAIAVLSEESAKVRKKYVSKVFYITALIQNGFIDALFILILSIQLIGDTFRIFHGRPPGFQMWDIIKKIYYAVIIGGSEAAEYASEEIFEKMATESVKGIPFAGRLIGSLTDGFVNASLLTRISYITENYCKKIYFDSPRELFPSGKAVAHTTSILTSGVFQKVVKKAKAQAGNFTSMVGNNFKNLFRKTTTEDPFAE